MRLYFPRSRGYLSDYCFTDLFKAIEDALSGEWCLDHIDEMSSVITVEVLNLPADAERVWTVTNGGTEGELVNVYLTEEQAERAMEDAQWFGTIAEMAVRHTSIWEMGAVEIIR